MIADVVQLGPALKATAVDNTSGIKRKIMLLLIVDLRLAHVCYIDTALLSIYVPCAMPGPSDRGHGWLYINIYIYI